MTREASEPNTKPAWLGASEQVFSSMLRANVAALTSLGFSSGKRRSSATGTGTDTGADEFDTEDWEEKKSIKEPGEVSVGDTVEFTKTLSDEDVSRFAAASGDINPLHISEEFADETRFDGRVVHGTLISGLVSAALSRLPGLTVYVSQDTRFLSPVRIGDRLTGRCEVMEETGEDLFRLATEVLNEEGETVIDGEAVVLIEEKPDGQSAGEQEH